MNQPPMGPGLIINAVGAALIDHHLRKRGQDISMLPQTIHPIIELNQRRFSDNDGWLHFTNDIHVSSRITDIPQVNFRLNDNKALHMPPLLGSVKEDDDGDLVFNMREMMISEEVFYNALPKSVRLVTTRRLPETLIVAAKDRALKDIISHPALDGRGVRIKAIANQPEGNTFNLHNSPAQGTAITLSPCGKIILPFE